MPPAIQDAADPTGPAPRLTGSLGLAADDGVGSHGATPPGPPDAGPSTPMTPSSPVPPATSPLGSAAPLPLQAPTGSGAGPDVPAGRSGAPSAGPMAPPVAAGFAALQPAAGPPSGAQDALGDPPATPTDGPQVPASSGGVAAASPPSGGAVYAFLTALLGLAAGLLGRLLLATRRWRPVVLIAQLERPG